MMDTPKAAGRFQFFSSSSLKLIACVLMLIDHIGFILIPTYLPLYRICRIIGRLSFPIFAFFIAEGCRYTRNKTRHFLQVFVLGAICETVYFFYEGRLQGNILLAFSFSILLIYCLGAVKHAFAPSGNVKKRVFSILLFATAITVTAFLCDPMDIDYGFAGVLIPVFTSLFDYKEGETPEFLRRLDRPSWKLLLFSLSLLLLVLDKGLSSIQTYCLLSIPLVALYNGKLGTRKLKYAFYIFYPVHLLLLEGIAMLLY